MFVWKNENFHHQILYLDVNKIQSVSGCQNHIVSQTAGPISVKIDRKAQLNHLGKIAIVLYL